MPMPLRPLSLYPSPPLNGLAMSGGTFFATSLMEFPAFLLMVELDQSNPESETKDFI